jgi:signal transduction histidine kinase
MLDSSDRAWSITVQPASIILIGPDGVVIAATWPRRDEVLDRHLASCSDVPFAIREAGELALRALQCGSANRCAVQVATLEGGAGVVQVIAVEAVGLRRQPTDIRQLLAAKLGVLQDQARAAAIAFSVHVGDDVPRAVPLDNEKVAWAVTTLVGNALRYVQTSSRQLGGKTVGVRSTYDPTLQALVIAVRDDGPGIPADTVSRLFHRDGLNLRGAGLAMAVIRDIMAAHGGAIDVRSSTDPAAHGTEVTLTFPLPVDTAE